MDVHTAVEGANLSCFADDITIWHSSNNIAEIETKTNTSLDSIAEWCKQNKLELNLAKSCYCLFTTDRKHRNVLPSISLGETQIRHDGNPRYLGVTLDAELRFTEHLSRTSIKATKKLNVMKKICGASWGARPSVLQATYKATVRPVIEFASPIWSHASGSGLRKLDSVQARAAKLICGATASTRNTTAELEANLPSLGLRQKSQVLKFTNKALSYHTQHIRRRTFQNWTKKCRLKRSSTLQYDEEIRQEIGLQHDTINMMQEEENYSTPLPQNLQVFKDLIHPCSKNDLPAILRTIFFETLEHRIPPYYTHIYTDGSSDNTLQNAGAGIYIKYPDNTSKETSAAAGRTASNFTAELSAILRALESAKSSSHNGLAIMIDSQAAISSVHAGNNGLSRAIRGKISIIGCPVILQWVPAHVGLFGNERADILAKKGRDLEQPTEVTLTDANIQAKHRLDTLHPVSYSSVCSLGASRKITSVLTRLKTGHTAGLRISPDGDWVYPSCHQCSRDVMSPQHLVTCPSIVCDINNICGDEDPLQVIRDLDLRAIKISELIINRFGSI